MITHQGQTEESVKQAGLSSRSSCFLTLPIGSDCTKFSIGKLLVLTIVRKVWSRDLFGQMKRKSCQRDDVGE